jgi:hypothetical protein
VLGLLAREHDLTSVVAAGKGDRAVEALHDVCHGGQPALDEVVVHHLLPLGFRLLLGRIEVRAREQPLRDRVGGGLTGERPAQIAEDPLQHLHLRRQEREHDRAAAARDRSSPAHRSCCIVAQSPCACRRATSFSQRSRVPLDTTALPSLCTCSISRRAFARE